MKAQPFQLTIFQGGANTQAEWIFLFMIGPVFQQVLLRAFTSHSLFLKILQFFLTLIEGFFVYCQGLILRAVFPIGVHSADESEISPRSCFMDLSRGSGPPLMRPRPQIWFLARTL